MLKLGDIIGESFDAAFDAGLLAGLVQKIEFETRRVSRTPKDKRAVAETEALKNIIIAAANCRRSHKVNQPGFEVEKSD